ncbi:MAG: hypothetical protein PSN37_04225 [Alphaproteobacteria bacterium]|nr:hypothetical protein [Alphaproteobacteria bacterium]
MIQSLQNSKGARFNQLVFFFFIAMFLAGAVLDYRLDVPQVFFAVVMLVLWCGGGMKIVLKR